MSNLKKSPRFRFLMILTALAAMAMAFTACGNLGEDAEEMEGLSEGEPVELGHLEYNVMFTRILNRGDVEDREYLVGQPELDPDQSYLGVFVKITNKSEDEPHTIPDSFVIRNTEGEEFENLPTESVYALRPGATIAPEDQIPAIDSTPEVGPIHGSLLLYRVTDESMEWRPMQLVIDGEGGPASVDLDL